MSTGQDDRVRRRAHEIWEQEGRPEGRHEEHWRRALDEVSRTSGIEEAQMNSMREMSIDPAEPPKPRGRRTKDAATTDSAKTSSVRRPRAPVPATSDGPGENSDPTATATPRRQRGASLRDPAGSPATEGADSAPGRARKRRLGGDPTKSEDPPRG